MEQVDGENYYYDLVHLFATQDMICSRCLEEHSPKAETKWYNARHVRRPRECTTEASINTTN
jgi:hypothetical protein